MAEAIKFDGCDAATVFAEVGKAAGTTEKRSLWHKPMQERRRKGVDGAVSYLEGEFQRIADSLDRELTRLEANQ